MGLILSFKSKGGDNNFTLELCVIQVKNLTISKYLFLCNYPRNLHLRSCIRFQLHFWVKKIFQITKLATLIQLVKEDVFFFVCL